MGAMNLAHILLKEKLNLERTGVWIAVFHFVYGCPVGNPHSLISTV